MTPFVLLALFAATPFAQSAPSGAGDAPSAAAPAKPSKPKKEPKVCRRDAKSNSRITVSTCHTASEWQAIDASGGDALVRGNAGH